MYRCLPRIIICTTRQQVGICINNLMNPYTCHVGIKLVTRYSGTGKNTTRRISRQGYGRIIETVIAGKAGKTYQGQIIDVNDQLG